jgi:hypothetical protein
MRMSKKSKSEIPVYLFDAKRIPASPRISSFVVDCAISPASGPFRGHPGGAKKFENRPPECTHPA